jgi:hypothetical protein
MKLGMMQPYFFPYIGYFELIREVDVWVAFDTAQYIRHGWVNRNRILHPKQGWMYILVPIQKYSQETSIRDIQVVKDSKWRGRLLGQLQHYRKKAPHFDCVYGIVSECLHENGYSLSRLNMRCLEKVCAYLDIPFNFRVLSEMDLNLEGIEGPGGWALRVAQALNANEYINAPGGAELFDRSEFGKADIKLTIQSAIDLVYDCNGFVFEPNLSIIDVMMWKSPAEIHDYLDLRQNANEP